MNFLLLSVKILHCSRAKYKSLPKITIITKIYIYIFLKKEIFIKYGLRKKKYRLIFSDKISLWFQFSSLVKFDAPTG